MKTILLLLCLALPCYAQTPMPPAALQPVHKADAPAKYDPLAELTKERDSLRAERDKLQADVRTLMVQANARLEALAAQRNDALNQVVNLRGELAALQAAANVKTAVDK